MCDEAPNPLHVRFLGAESHMSHAQCGSYLVQQFRLAGGPPHITRLTDHSLAGQRQVRPSLALLNRDLA